MLVGVERLGPGPNPRSPAYMESCIDLPQARLHSGVASPRELSGYEGTGSAESGEGRTSGKMDSAYGLGPDSLPSFVTGLISLSLFFLSEKVLSQGMVCKAGMK